MKFYQLLTEASQYIIPQLYKQRFFKKQNQLSRENIISKGKWNILIDFKTLS